MSKRPQYLYAIRSVRTKSLLRHMWRSSLGFNRQCTAVYHSRNAAQADCPTYGKVCVFREVRSPPRIVRLGRGPVIDLGVKPVAPKRTAEDRCVPMTTTDQMALQKPRKHRNQPKGKK